MNRLQMSFAKLGRKVKNILSSSPSLKRSLASVQPSKVVGRIHRDHVDMKLINGESTISHRKSLASAVMYEILVVDLHHDA
jgi:hypothetical protein